MTEESQTEDQQDKLHHLADEVSFTEKRIDVTEHGAEIAE